MGNTLKLLIPASFALAAVLVTLPARNVVKGAAAPRQLRVCSDPNNLPFSNSRLEGFENRIAELIAAELNARVQYTWWPQRRAFLRNTLRAEECDVVMGLPSGYERAALTKPYYRSTYVFVFRKDRGLDIRSFDDPLLKELRIGVHMIGDDYANTPPAHALSKRNIVRNVIGYRIFGDYSEDNPPARIVDAVAEGEVDVAVVWGPLGGYFAARHPVAMEVVPVSPHIDLPFLPFVFDICLGVRREDRELRAELDGVLDRKREEIRRILEEFGVPQVERKRRGPAISFQGE